jgi:Gly-Xaa carboxypeptidase
LAGGSESAHTINERVRMDVHMEMLKFYYNFVRNFNEADL